MSSAFAIFPLKMSLNRFFSNHLTNVFLRSYHPWIISPLKKSNHVPYEVVRRLRFGVKALVWFSFCGSNWDYLSEPILWLGSNSNVPGGRSKVALVDQKEKVQNLQSLMLKWLTDSSFLYKVSSSVADLISFVQSNTLDADSDSNHRQLRGILTQTRNCFIQLMSRLSRHFESTSSHVPSLNSERSCLSQRLLRGLHATMRRLTPEQRAPYVSARVSLTFLIDLNLVEETNLVWSMLRPPRTQEFTENS